MTIDRTADFYVTYLQHFASTKQESLIYKGSLGNCVGFRTTKPPRWHRRLHG